MSKKGLISVDTECPKSFDIFKVLLGLSHKKGLILADARCPSMNNDDDIF